jgi:hypothetical protein
VAPRQGEGGAGQFRPFPRGAALTRHGAAAAPPAARRQRCSTAGGQLVRGGRGRMLSQHPCAATRARGKKTHSSAGALGAGGGAGPGRGGWLLALIAFIVRGPSRPLHLRARRTRAQRRPAQRYHWHSRRRGAARWGGATAAALVPSMHRRPALCYPLSVTRPRHGAGSHDTQGSPRPEIRPCLVCRAFDGVITGDLPVFETGAGALQTVPLGGALLLVAARRANGGLGGGRGGEGSRSESAALARSRFAQHTGGGSLLPSCRRFARKLQPDWPPCLLLSLLLLLLLC